MSSLAEQALEHARQRLAGQPPKAPTLVVPKINMPVTAPISTAFVATGPISHHLFLEGRAWAVDMVAAIRSQPAAKVIERLAGARAGKPASYAAGIQSVITALQEDEPCP